MAAARATWPAAARHRLHRRRQLLPERLQQQSTTATARSCAATTSPRRAKSATTATPSRRRLRSDLPWREKLDVICGYAGTTATPTVKHGTRAGRPSGIAYDAGNPVLYVADKDCTIRKLSGTLVTPDPVTLTGNAYDASSDGTLAHARYNFAYNADYSINADLAFLGGALYVGQATTLRKVDLAGNLVKDVVSGVNVTGVATDGTLVYFVDSTVATGGFKSFNPANGNVATLANYATLYAGNSSCGHPYCAPGGTSCLVPCGNYVASVNTSNGAVSAFAGKYDSGTSKYVDACTAVNSSTPLAGNALTFSNAIAITAADATHIYILDLACGSVIAYNGSTGYLYSGAGKYTGSGYVEGVPAGSAVYDNPHALQYIDGSALLILDSGNGVLRNIESSVNTVSGAAEHPEALSSQGSSNFGTFWTDVASDGSSLYSINLDGRIAKISTATGGVTTVAPAWVEMSAVLHDVIYAGGSLYAHTNDGIIESVNVNGTGAAIYAGTTGSVTSPPTDGPRLSAIVNPGGMTSDGTNIYFTDTYKLVRSIDAGGMVHTLAGDINSADNADGTGSAAHFFAATALTTDGKYLYIADGATYGPQVPPTPTAVRRLNLATKVVDTIAGSVSVSGHVDAVGTAARFGNINGLASDGISLFIADANPAYPSSAHDGPTIRQLVLATGNVGTMIGANGQESFVPGVGTVARVHGPTSLVFDAASHSLYFQDIAESVFARIK